MDSISRPLLTKALLWGLTGPALCYALLAINYFVTEGPFPGYRFFCYPGILATRLVSEETFFAYKLGLMFVGQYLAYFPLAFITLWLTLKLGEVLKRA